MENQHFTHKYALAINSIACIILSGFMTTILHELAHFIPAYFYGLNPELHHNFVWYKDEPTQLYQAVIIPAAGPIFSLILGLICLYFSKKIVEKGVLSLFLLWMGLQGYVTFFGYLLIAPFFTYGDTGRVFALLNLPQMLVIALSIAAIIALTLLVKKEFKEFGYYGNPDYTIKERANALILFPVLGSIASAVLQLPVPTVLSIIAPLTMPLTFMSVYGTFRRRTKEAATVPMNISWLLMGCTLLSIIVFRLLNYPVAN